jgi:hypothetical protein
MHAQEEQKLRVLVHEAHEKSRKTCGSPRVLDAGLPQPDRV